MHELPSALESVEDIIARAQGRRVVVFLDYDGTLTPIVARPELATLSEDMRATLKALAARCPVAIISGRDRADVERLVGLDSLVYAGSHGFDIADPTGHGIQHEEGAGFITDVERAERALRTTLSGIPGALVERKKYSVAVHYRLVASEHISGVRAATEAVLSDHPNLRMKTGKKVLELQPAIDWDKGKAVLWVLRALKLEPGRVLPLYLGDDVTDEDAFVALRDFGVGIFVGEPSSRTAARYALAHDGQVRLFLEKLTALIGE